MGVNNSSADLQDSLLAGRVESPWTELAIEVVEDMGNPDSGEPIDPSDVITSINTVVEGSKLHVDEIPIDNETVQLHLETLTTDHERVIVDIFQQSVRDAIEAGTNIDDWNAARGVASDILEVYSKPYTSTADLGALLINSEYTVPYPSTVISVLEAFVDEDKQRDERMRILARWLLMWEPHTADMSLIGREMALSSIELPDPESFSQWAVTSADAVEKSTAENPAPYQLFESAPAFGKTRSLASQLYRASDIESERSALIEEYEIYLPPEDDLTELIVASEESDEQTVDDIARGLADLTSPEYESADDKLDSSEFNSWDIAIEDMVDTEVAALPSLSEKYDNIVAWSNARSVASRLNTAENIETVRETIIAEEEIYLPSETALEQLVEHSQTTDEIIDEIARGIKSLDSPAISEVDTDHYDETVDSSEANKDAVINEEGPSSSVDDSETTSEPSGLQKAEETHSSSDGPADSGTSTTSGSSQDKSLDKQKVEFKPASESDLQDVAAMLDRDDFTQIDLRFPQLLSLARDLVSVFVDREKSYEDVAAEYPDVGYPDRTTAMMDISNTSGQNTEQRVAQAAELVATWQAEGFDEFDPEIVNSGFSPYNPNR